VRFAKMASAVFRLAISHRKPLWCSPESGVAQLEERELPKPGIAGANLVARSMHSKAFRLIWRYFGGMCYGKGSFSSLQQKDYFHD
jgi:hypothetical protein